MLETKNKKLQKDLDYIRKYPQKLKDIDKRSFINKFGIIIFYPIIIMLILSILLYLIINEYVSLYILMVTTYLASFYLCLIEYFTFNKMFLEFPDFAYVYIKSQTDIETKKDYVYVKDTQKYYNLIIKTKSIAKYRLNIKAIVGSLLNFLVFFIVGIFEPTAMPLFWGFLIISIIYFIIDLIMVFFGKSDV